VVNGAPTIQGIALGNFGEPIGYWLFPTHPGAWMLPGARLASNFIPARDVLHVFRKRRPGQLRDVSWLAPVLLRLRDLGDYEAALLMKAKIEACLAAVVTDDGEETLTKPRDANPGLLRDAQGRAVESFEPGMILYRRGHGEVNVVNPSGGGSSSGLSSHFHAFSSCRGDIWLSTSNSFKFACSKRICFPFRSDLRSGFVNSPSGVHAPVD
jgi:hypothetical protein